MKKIYIVAMVLFLSNQESYTQSLHYDKSWLNSSVKGSQKLVIDGKLYISGISGTYCVDPETGNQLWFSSKTGSIEEVNNQILIHRDNTISLLDINNGNILYSNNFNSNASVEYKVHLEGSKLYWATYSSDINFLPNTALGSFVPGPNLAIGCFDLVSSTNNWTRWHYQEYINCLGSSFGPIDIVDDITTYNGSIYVVNNVATLANILKLDLSGNTYEVLSHEDDFHLYNGRFYIIDNELYVIGKYFRGSSYLKITSTAFTWESTGGSINGNATTTEISIENSRIFITENYDEVGISIIHSIDVKVRSGSFLRHFFIGRISTTIIDGKIIILSPSLLQPESPLDGRYEELSQVTQVATTQANSYLSIFDAKSVQVLTVQGLDHIYDDSYICNISCDKLFIYNEVDGLEVHEAVIDFDIQNNFIEPSELSDHCINSTVPPIEGENIAEYADFIPLYQWQISDDNINWTDIPVAIQKDYIPTIFPTDRWYRRQLYNPCTIEVISTSNVSHVEGSSFEAPSVDLPTGAFTCPGIPVSLGGDLAVSGGGMPYSYNWDMTQFLDVSNVENPIATVQNSTLFTLVVTDANGCSQVVQKVVKVIEADAGDETFICEGILPETTSIGKAIPGYDLEYNWTPSAGLSCDDCPMPIVDITSSETYQLSLELENSDGTFCSTTDEVNVVYNESPDPLPSNVFVVCTRNNLEIGTIPEVEYEYNWVPANKTTDLHRLTNNNTSNPTFFAIQESQNIISNPLENPQVYRRVVSRDECNWTEEVMCYTIDAYAGPPGCGPRTLGDISRKPQHLDIEYSWTVLSGPDNITGPRDEVLTTVEGSDTETSVYQLEACYLGTCCTGEVRVPPCGCDLDITGNGCRLGDGSEYSASVRYSPGLAQEDWDFRWEPCASFVDCNQSSVSLVSDVPTSIEVTATLISDPSVVCTRVINNLGPPTDIIDYNPGGPYTACAGDILEIGLGGNGDYSFSWSILGFLDRNRIDEDDFWIDDNQNNAPTPVFIVPELNPGLDSFNLQVLVSSGPCGTIREEVLIYVYSKPHYSDVTTCPNDEIILGNDNFIVDEFNYLWSPNANWINGTNSSSPNPELEVSGEFDFIVSMTESTSGCMFLDTVLVSAIVNPEVDAGPDVITCQNEEIQIGLDLTDNIIAYEWTPSIGLSCIDCPQPIVTTDVSRSYSLVVTYEGGCRSIADDVLVEVYDPNLFVLEDRIYCPSDGEVELNPENAGHCNDCTYLWRGPNLSASNIIDPVSTVNRDATYTLVITDMNGCISSSTTAVSLSENTDAGSDKSICIGSTVELGNPLNDESTVWSPADNLSCDNCAETVFTGVESGTYILTATSIINGCTVTDEVEVEVTEITSLDLPEEISSCQNGCIDLFFEISDGYTYTVNTDLEFIEIDNGITVCPKQTDFVTIRYINQSSGCFLDHEVFINIYDEAAPVLSASTLVLCDDNPIEVTNLSIDGSQEVTINWSPLLGLSDPSIVNPIIGPSQLPFGISKYTVVVTSNENSCSSLATIEVARPDLRNMEVTLDICQNSCLMIGEPFEQGVSYSWVNLNADDENYIEVCPEEFETYELVKTIGECMTRTIYNVNVTSDAQPTLDIDNPEICETDIANLNPIVGPASEDYSYSWSPQLFFSNANIENPILFNENLTEGVNLAQLTVTDISSGCSNVASLSINLISCQDSENSCYAITAESTPCNSDIDTESENTYTYNFTFTNNNESSFDKLLLFDNDDNFTLDAGGTLIQLPAELAPGQSVELSWGIDALNSFNSETMTYCFEVAPYNSNGPCCKEEHCIELINCCPAALPPTKSVEQIDSDECCYGFSYETCIEDYIVVADFAMLTEDLGMTGTPIVDGFQVNTFSDRTFSVTMQGGNFLPAGDFQNIIELCVDGMTSNAPEEQQFTVTWRALEGNELVSMGTDTCSLACPVPEDQCAELVEPTVFCDENGVYHYQFSVRNINDRMLDASILVLGPEGTTVPGDFSMQTFPDFPLNGSSDPAYLPYQSVTGVIDVTLPNAVLGSTYEFILSLHDYRNLNLEDNDYWCCYTPTTFTIDVDEPCDSDGTTLVSRPVEYFIYPNPSSEVFTVRFLKPLETDSELVMIDLNGVVKNRAQLAAGVMAHSLNISSFNTGMYFISVSDAEGNEHSERFLKK